MVSNIGFLLLYVLYRLCLYLNIRQTHRTGRHTAKRKEKSGQMERREPGKREGYGAGIMYSFWDRTVNKNRWSL